ncbi:MAG: hypothetical protein RIB43_15680 [Rhodospirillaceae bacterium]
MPFAPTGDPEDDEAPSGKPRLRLSEIGGMWYVRGVYKGVRVPNIGLNVRGTDILALKRAQSEVARLKHDILSGNYKRATEEVRETEDKDGQFEYKSSDESNVSIGPVLRISALVRQKLEESGRSCDDLTALMKACWDDFEALSHRWIAKEYFLKKFTRVIPVLLDSGQMTKQQVQDDLVLLAKIWDDHFSDSGEKNPYTVTVDDVKDMGQPWNEGL